MNSINALDIIEYEQSIIHLTISIGFCSGEAMGNTK